MKDTLSLHDKVGAVQLLAANAAEQLRLLQQDIDDPKQVEIAMNAVKLAGDSLRYLLKDLKGVT